jgi:hypothetical protein
MTWQDISTAPKDGTRILLWCAAPMLPTVGWWEPQASRSKPRPFWCSERAWLFGNSWARESQPTHWMPLPAPPEAA